MSNINFPTQGQLIRYDTNKHHLIVPDNPVIGFIEGDGIGADITPVMLDVVNEAVKKAYQDTRKIHWMELYAGEKAVTVYGENQWLPEETIECLKQIHVAIKGPLTTPVSGGFRSLNVAIRQLLDLYVCLRPIRYYSGVPSPLKRPQDTDIVIFRENSEDIYAGIEWMDGMVGHPTGVITQSRFVIAMNQKVKPVTWTMIEFTDGGTQGCIIGHGTGKINIGQVLLQPRGTKT